MSRVLQWLGKKTFRPWCRDKEMKR